MSVLATQGAKRQTCAVAAILMLGMTQAARAELPTYHGLPYAAAMTMAEGTIQSCAAMGYAVSVVVVDRDGETIVLARGDNASPHTVENARRKAYTALTFRRSTTDYAKLFADNNPTVRMQVTLPSVIAISGGLPIMVGAEVVGGIGASGSPGVDEDCVKAGLAKAADQMK